MAFDYFYEEQSQQFAFYRIPKVLFTDNRFQKISTEGRVLYGLLLDRVSLSRENGWIDEEGRVYCKCQYKNVGFISYKRVGKPTCLYDIF